MKTARVSRSKSLQSRPAPNTTGARKKQMNAGSRTEPRTLLVPIDFSAGSLRALDFAGSLARRFNAAMIIVHVIDPIHTPGRYDSQRLRSLRREALEGAKAKMANLAFGRSELSQSVKDHVISGIVHAAIVQFANKTKSDWIVMGSKGQTGIKRLLAGSVAENVVRHARCPVLVVP